MSTLPRDVLNPARLCNTALLLLLIPFSANAGTSCEHVLKALGNRLADATCFESTDLTTNNPLTTPANNSLPGLPAFAFTPQTDRAVIAPSAAKKTPVTKVVPGSCRSTRASLRTPPARRASCCACRMTGTAAWWWQVLLGTRSEFNGDFVWSDYVVQRGYAYASQNKGVLNLQLSTAADPLACRLNPLSPVFVHFYDNDPGEPFTRAGPSSSGRARLAKDA